VSPPPGARDALAWLATDLNPETIAIARKPAVAMLGPRALHPQRQATAPGGHDWLPSNELS